MKKLLSLIVILFALGYQNDVNAITIVQKDMGFVSVNATATKEITPDTAAITFIVQSTATDSKEVVEKNKESSTKLYDDIKSLIGEKDILQTKNFVLKPNYSEDKTGKKTFLNYTASNTIYVKTKNLDNISKLIDIAATNKASINQLNFYLENEKQFEGSLAKEALENAQIIAQMTASTLGQKVKGIKSVRVNIYPQASSSVYGMSATNAKTTPIERGKVKLQANVNAEFYVK